jgi:uncharacterized protein
MPGTITIQAGGHTLQAELNDTRTATAILEALPIEVAGNTWGDEIYFEIPVDEELEDGQEVVEVGDLGFWPTGNAFCIFYGPTPMSRGDEVRPASAVTVVGRIAGDATVLRGSSGGISVRLSKNE